MSTWQLLELGTRAVMTAQHLGVHSGCDWALLLRGPWSEGSLFSLSIQCFIPRSIVLAAGVDGFCEMFWDERQTLHCFLFSSGTAVRDGVKYFWGSKWCLLVILFICSTAPSWHCVNTVSTSTVHPRFTELLSCYYTKYPTRKWASEGFVFYSFIPGVD